MTDVSSYLVGAAVALGVYCMTQYAKVFYVFITFDWVKGF